MSFPHSQQNFVLDAWMGVRAGVKSLLNEYIPGPSHEESFISQPKNNFPLDCVRALSISSVLKCVKSKQMR